MAAPPLRVVSLLPSATEIVCLVGAANLMVGRSHECDYPAALASLPVLTAAPIKFESSRQVHEEVCAALQAGRGLYTVDAETLAALKPDVVFTQSLCNVCSVDLCLVQKIVAGMDPPPKVVDMNPFKLQEVLACCTDAGEALGLQEGATAAVAALQERVGKASALGAELSAAKGRPTVAFLEWTDPFFIGGHWTPQLIEMAGGHHRINPVKDAEHGAGKSIAVERSVLVEDDPDVIIVCPCGLDLPATEKELASVMKEPFWASLRAVKAGRVALVDGNQMFNRPGPRLVDALEWLVGFLHDRPDLIPAGFPWKRLDA